MVDHSWWIADVSLRLAARVPRDVVEVPGRQLRHPSRPPLGRRAGRRSQVAGGAGSLRSSAREKDLKELTRSKEIF